MKAIVQDTYGSADVLELRDIDPPTAGNEDVLVRVHAAGVDAGVVHLMTGLPYLLRLFGYGLRAPRVRVRALTPRGTLVIMGGEGGGRWLGGVDRQLRAMLPAPFVGHRLLALMSAQREEDLSLLAELIEDGRVTPVIGRTYSLSEVPDAVRYVAEGHARGKVVITL